MTSVMVWRSYTYGRGPPLKVVTALFASVYTLLMKRFQFWTKKLTKQKWGTKTLSPQLATLRPQPVNLFWKKKSVGLLLLILHFMLHSARSNLYSQPEMADDGRCSQLLATITVNAEGIIKCKHTTVANDGRSTSNSSLSSLCFWIIAFKKNPQKTQQQINSQIHMYDSVLLAIQMFQLLT